MENSNHLKSFFTEHWKYLAVSTACKLNLFELIDNKPLKAVEISSLLNLNQKYALIFLKALSEYGFLIEKNEKYSLTNLSQLLVEGHPESLKYACLNWAGEHLNAWQTLDNSLNTGKSYFSSQYGTNYFEYLNKHPEKLYQYHKAMFEYARDDYKTLTDKIDFSIHKSIMDVGSGFGAALTSISIKYPFIDCYYFDLDPVIALSPVDEKSKIKGDFFINIPNIADAIILSRILHDWDDEKAEIILHNCYDALQKGNYLYIIENCSDLINIDLSLLSLNMLVICESYERTSMDYTELAENSGFKFISKVQLNELQTIIIFIKK